jgi:hypothetical protein
MRITFLAVFVTLIGCGGMNEDGAATDAPDAGSMVAPQTGGAGGTGAGGAPAPDSGNVATAGTGGSVGGAGGAGGTGGTVATDAQPVTPPPADAQPVTGLPQACMVDRLHTDVCTDHPGVKNAKVLYLNGRVCDICVTTEVDGMTIKKQYVGCAPQLGVVCVMSCGECK